MQAMCLNDGKVSVQEIEVPEPQRDEALIRVQMAGVCNTDVEIAKGYMGFSGVLGHELYGVVEQAPDPQLVGARVAGEINLGCGRCEVCGRGLSRHCPTRTVMGILGKDGCFAQYVTLPLSNIHPLPDQLGEQAACFVEPTAAAFEILEQRPIDRSEDVLVLGDGKLGQLVARVLTASGADPILVGKHERKLALARRCGVRTAELGDLGSKRFDVVVEATGSAAGLTLAVQLTRPRGTLVLKSTYHGPVTLDAAPLVIDEIQLLGSRCGPFAPAIAALASGAVDIRGLVDDRLPLSRGPRALERAQEPGVMKVLLEIAC